ncbi:MAG: hypothetical protein OXH98_17005 [Caldilineaceae bacterium]|nr:hypothetical protein [Caldilineaceae bacterium]
MANRSLRRLGWTVLGGLLAAASLPNVAQAAGLDQLVETELAPIVPAMIPLLGAAAGIERLLELGWHYLEWGALRFLGWRPSDLKSPGYVAFKRSTSLLAGIFLGVVVANYSGMRLMSYLNQSLPGFLDQVPDLWDILVTGVMVGAGTKPTHDILGIITQLKNLIGSTALKQKEQAGAALADSILKLRQADAPASYQVDVPGVGATQVPGAAGQAPRNRMLDETGGRRRERNIDRYANALHDNLYSSG